MATTRKSSRGKSKKSTSTRGKSRAGAAARGKSARKKSTKTSAMHHRSGSRARSASPRKRTPPMTRPAPKPSAVAQMKRVATEIVTQAVDAGKIVVDETKAMGERVGEATTNLVNRVT